MSGRAATTSIIPGKYAISVGDPGTPLPAGWARVPLLSVAELGTGHTPSRNCSEYWNGGIPWIGIRDARAHHAGLISNTLETVSDLGLQYSAARLLPADTVGLSRTASVGYVFIMARAMATSQDFVTWTCSRAIEPRYLMYALLAEGDDIRRFGKGSTHTTIYFPEVKAFHVALAPKAEQKRIVRKLDGLRARSARARRELEAIPSLVERCKQAVLVKAFSGELTADWRKRNSASKALKPFLTNHTKVLRRRLQEPTGPDGSALDRLPAGWHWLQAQDVVEPEADIVYGIVQPGPKLDTGVPYVRGMDIQNGKILVDQLMKTSPAIAQRYSRASLRDGDVLLGIIRETKVAIVPKVLNGANITQGTARLRPANFVRPAYLASWLSSEFAQKWLHDHYRGIDMPGLNLRDVRRCPIPTPTPGEQDEIIRRLSSCFAWLDKIAGEHARAAALLPGLDQSILAKAFRGGLVPQDPDDEPASVLVKHIRPDRERVVTPRRRSRNA